MTTSLRSFLYSTAGIIFFLALLGYAVIQGQNYLAGPVLEISSPVNGETYTEARISLSGQTEFVTEITVNGRPILIDETGNFVEALLLLEGYNMIVIEAKDRFDRITREEIEVVYKL